MATIKYIPTISVTNFSELASTPGILGQEAVAEDTLVRYVFDGTNWIDTPLRKLTTKGNPPTLTMASGAGTGATGSVNGTNSAGTITITTGITLTTDGNLFSLSLGAGESFPNKMILQLQGNDAASLLAITSIFPAVLNAASVTVKMKGLGLSVTTTYNFSYQILGY